MFYSQYSGKLFGPGIKPVLIAIETRPKTYFNKKGFEIAKGFETVKEIRVARSEVEVVLKELNATRQN